MPNEPIRLRVLSAGDIPLVEWREDGNYSDKGGQWFPLEERTACTPPRVLLEGDIDSIRRLVATLDGEPVTFIREAWPEDGKA